jgi:pimeloyl-ACP methyl ester carboxylesterase
MAAYVLAGAVCTLLSSSTPVGAATVDGFKVHSTVKGNGSATLFLIHGYTCDETTWTEQVRILARQYRVVTVDLPGHGKSGRPAAEQFSMDLFARAIEAVRLDLEVDRITLVGHSMGTPVILKYAHLYPEHTAALVFVDGLMPAAPSSNGRARPAGSAAPSTTSPQSAGARMGGPNGRQNREAMVRRFFLPTTPPAVQRKVLAMMLAAPEATAVGAMSASNDPAGRTIDVPDVPMIGIYAEPIRARGGRIVLTAGTPASCPCKAASETARPRDT